MAAKCRSETQKGMKLNYLFWVGVSLFPFLSNGQDNAVYSETNPATAFGTQGNVATNQSIRDNELKRAVQDARELRAIKESMASSATNAERPTIYTAEQFLAANRPPALPPREREFPERRSSYVPEFETGVVNNSAEPPTDFSPPQVQGTREEMPRRRKGIFGLFMPQEREQEFEASVPPPEYRDLEPQANPDAPLDSTDLAAQEVAMMEATQSAPNEEAGLFGRLFKTKQQDQSPPAPQVDYPDAQIEMVESQEAELPPSPAEGIPDVPAVDEEVAPPPSAPAETASIFVRRSSESPGTPATISSRVQANVAGVRVTLYEGNTVTLLENQGSVSKIRLPDGRVGTVDASKLTL